MQDNINNKQINDYNVEKEKNHPLYDYNIRQGNNNPIHDYIIEDNEVDQFASCISFFFKQLVNYRKFKKIPAFKSFNTMFDKRIVRSQLINGGILSSYTDSYQNQYPLTYPYPYPYPHPNPDYLKMLENTRNNNSINYNYNSSYNDNSIKYENPTMSQYSYNFTPFR